MPEPGAPRAAKATDAGGAPDSGRARGADAADADDDIKIYRRAGANPDAKPDLDAPEAPEETGDVDAPMDAGEETDFFTRRERVRRLYEEDWPELSAREMPRARRVREPARRERETGDFARPSRDGARRPPTLSRDMGAETGRASTLIPRRDDVPDPDRLFTVRGEMPFDEDDFYRPARAPRGRTNRRVSAYEEPESHSFFVRHVRGIVALILLLITVTIVAAWAITPSAQIVLARLDLAWSGAAYATLGYEAYEARNYDAAGRYYDAARERDPDNYGYAVAAANAYIESGDDKRAIAAIRACIALEPGNAQLYVNLMNLYNGYENMPEDARRIIDEGYERTGDQRLKQ